MSKPPIEFGTMPVEREWLLIGQKFKVEKPEARECLLPITLQPWAVKLLVKLYDHSLVFQGEAYTATVSLASPCCGRELAYLTREEMGDAFLLVSCPACSTLLWSEHAGTFKLTTAKVRAWDETGKALPALSQLREALHSWLMDTAAPTIALPLLEARYEELLEEQIQELMRGFFPLILSFDPL